MSNVYLPQVYANDAIAGQGEPHLMNAAALAFAVAWLGLLGERRARMRCDSRLVAAAQLHADYLAQRTGDALQMSMHRGEGGSFANERVAASGYRLPANYDAQANNVESCARNGADPATVAITLAAHEGHRQHMLGLGGFEGHVVWGCGAAGDDYVILICPEEAL